MAEATGLDVEAIYRFESGECATGDRYLSRIACFCAALGVDAGELLSQAIADTTRPVARPSAPERLRQGLAAVLESFGHAPRRKPAGSSSRARRER